MKIAVAYPPLESKKGIPLLGQNRQFQWAHDPWYAYPMVPASAATLLKEAGYEVVWMDGIAGEQTYEEWLEELKKEKPDLIVIETKTPVIKRHWRIISDVKRKFKHLQGDRSPGSLEVGVKVVLVGDHTTALPEESFEKSEVDYVLTGGDYDFLLLNLVNHLEKGEKLEPGIFYRAKRKDHPSTHSADAQGRLEQSRKATSSGSPLRSEKLKVKNSGKFQLNHDLDKLPFVDRNLTRWGLYAYKNSNYCRKPGTYTMFGRDCWWGRCSFCSWTTLYPGKCFRSISPQKALDEVGHIVDNYPIREIMDDSGTFPVGDWLREFCQEMIDRGYNKRVKIDCNMRFNSGLSQEDYNLMARAGFRFLLYGLESANQKTLDRINKNLKVEQITEGSKMAKKAGLWPHITAMVGYPWETREDAERTLNLARDLFKKGWVDTLQATVVVPYPETPLFEECKKNNWLKTLDWDRYDMREPVMKTPMEDEEILSLVRGLYGSFLSPRFIFRKSLEALRDPDVFRYYWSLAMKYFSKRLDFRK